MMDHVEYNEIIEHLGLSKIRAGPFFGYSPRQGQRFSTGEFPIPVSLALCLRLARAHNYTIADLERTRELT